jgi:hypothetical protein
MSEWTTEFYQDDAGRRPVELWMSSTTLAEFAALRAATAKCWRFEASSWGRRRG